MSFNLSNRFEAKVKKGDRILKLTDLVVLGVRGSYDFLYKEKGRSRGLSDISSSLGIRPPGVDLTVSVDGTWNPENWALRRLQVHNSFSMRGSGGTGASARTGADAPGGGGLDAGPDAPGGGDADAPSQNAPRSRPWQIGLRFGLGWIRNPRSFTTSGTGSVELNLTEKWWMRYSTQVDLHDKDVVYQEFSVHRDLHCWEAWFTRRFSGGTWESYFRIAAKLLPEVKYEKGTRDRGNFLGGFWQ
jgi:hypothetical protein